MQRSRIDEQRPRTRQSCGLIDRVNKRRFSQAQRSCSGQPHSIVALFAILQPAARSCCRSSIRSRFLSLCDPKPDCYTSATSLSILQPAAGVVDDPGDVLEHLPSTFPPRRAMVGLASKQRRQARWTTRRVCRHAQIICSRKVYDRMARPSSEDQENKVKADVFHNPATHAIEKGA